MEMAHYAVISQDRREEFAHLGIIITALWEWWPQELPQVRDQSPPLAAAAPGGDSGNPEKLHFVL